MTTLQEAREALDRAKIDPNLGVLIFLPGDWKAIEGFLSDPYAEVVEVLKGMIAERSEIGYRWYSEHTLNDAIEYIRSLADEPDEPEDDMTEADKAAQEAMGEDDMTEKETCCCLCMEGVADKPHRKVCDSCYRHFSAVPGFINALSNNPYLSGLERAVEIVAEMQKEPFPKAHIRARQTLDNLQYRLRSELEPEKEKPRNGSRYLVLIDMKGEHVHDRSHWEIGYYWKGEWFESWEGPAFNPQPDRWMELPPIDNQTEGGE